MSITTKFTKLLNLKSPIVSAPMYYASTPEMASAVTAFGAFGTIAAGFDSSAQLKEQLVTIRAKLNIPAGQPVPVGVAFIAWITDKTEASDDPRIPTVLNEKPAAVWFAFGNNLDKYVAQVRAYDAQRSHKTTIFVMVQSVEEAVRAANEWKVDVIVLEGIEAGGHGAAKGPTLSNLVTAATAALPNGPPMLAAGGITTGAQIAALLTMGVDGVVVGTRFLYTHECGYDDNMKSVLIHSDLNSTVRSHMFDEMNRTNVWPEGLDGRAIANKIVEDHAEGLDLEERLKRHDEGKAKGEKDRLVIWAGDGVGIVKEIKSTTEVTGALHNEAIASIRATYKFID